MTVSADITRKFDSDFTRIYDSKVRSTVPAYDTVHRMARAVLLDALPAKADILVVGPGTGMEFRTLVPARAGWKFEGVDVSPEMLSSAARLVAESGWESRVSLHSGPVDALPADRVFDAAVSILVMHFQPDGGPKLKYLQALRKRIGPGGKLILVDLHGDKDAPGFNAMYAVWKAFLTDSGYDAGGLDQELSIVKFVPEDRILSLAREAGFPRASRFYQGFLFGGWIVE